MVTIHFDFLQDTAGINLIFLKKFLGYIANCLQKFITVSLVQQSPLSTVKKSVKHSVFLI